MHYTCTIHDYHYYETCYHLLFIIYGCIFSLLLISKIHDMALNHELSSVQHEGNMRNMTTNLNSTISQLETTETSNTQLQQKVQ